MHINLLSRNNKAGLQKDYEILTPLLQSFGHHVEVNLVEEKASFYMIRGPKYDLNLIFHDPHPFWYKAAKKNYYIPCQEYLSSDPTFYRQVDLFLCRTCYAEKCLQSARLPAKHMGFTSEDHLRPNIQKERRFLHLAGGSLLKGTEAIIEAWRNNPDFPELILVVHPQCKDPKLPNLTFINTYLDAEEIITLQNSCLFHLYPSQVEGWGYALMEALSAKAILITTDAPPMNEHVKPERGFLVPPYHSTKMGMGEMFYISVQAIADTVRLLLQNNDLEQIQENGRRFWKSNHERFIHQLKNLLDSF